MFWSRQHKLFMYLSLTLEQGCIISSLAAIRATQPSTMLFRYTIGVLPISCHSICKIHGINHITWTKELKTKVFESNETLIIKKQKQNTRNIWIYLSHIILDWVLHATKIFEIPAKLTSQIWVLKIGKRLYTTARQHNLLKLISRFRSLINMTMNDD